MDISAKPIVVQPAPEVFSAKNMIIAALVILLLLSFLGINLFLVSGKLFEEIKTVLQPVVGKALGLLGYSSGVFIDKAGDVSTDAVKFSADIANGALDSASKLLITASKPLIQSGDASALDNVLVQNKPACKHEPKPDMSGSATQSSISANKQRWCLVEEINQNRRCLGIQESEKCMSGQVFDTHSACLSPPSNAPASANA